MSVFTAAIDILFADDNIARDVLSVAAGDPLGLSVWSPAAQIAGAGLDQRLANTIWSDQFLKGKPILSAAAVIWSKAAVIINTHDTGPLIRSKSGFWLAFPTAAGGKFAHGGRTTPREWERRSGLRLCFVFRRTGVSLLVAKSGSTRADGP